jgi:hypothetical protein
VIIPLEDRLAEALGPGGRDTLLNLLHRLNTAAAKALTYFGASFPRLTNHVS